MAEGNLRIKRGKGFEGGGEGLVNFNFAPPASLKNYSAMRLVEHT
jgi:hypothetical protein